MTTGWAGRHEALVSPDDVAPYGGDPWVSRRASRCPSGDTQGDIHGRPQTTPAVTLPHRCDGCTCGGGRWGVRTAGSRWVVPCTAHACAPRGSM